MMVTAAKSAPLAVNGGSPVRTHPFAPWPHIGKDALRAAARVLRSGKVNYWTGDEGRRFEGEFAATSKCRHGVAVANGTLALELALWALGIAPGDEVVVPCRTFIATASCVAMRGATPVFADVDLNSQNLTADTIQAVLTPRTKAIIAVHLAGWPCDMDPILDLSRRHGLNLIEDCAQAQGATYKGWPVGSFGDAAAFSFCQDKILTTAGEGGMVVTNHEETWRRAWAAKDHGKDYEVCFGRSHPPGYRWIHDSLGTNWRMTEVQAAVGRSSLPQVPRWVTQRRRHAAQLTERLAQVQGLRVTVPPSHISHCYYKYYAFIQKDRLREGWDRDRIMMAIQAEGIPCFSGVCGELYREKAFASLRTRMPRLPVARELEQTSLMFLVHPTLGSRDIEDTYRAIEKVMAAACW